MKKLPASKFDEIYEACMKSGGGEGGQYKGHTFYGNVWHKIGPSVHSEYVRTFGGWNKDLLEAYRTGEIRDRGAMYKEARVFWRDGKAHLGCVLAPIVDTPQQPWYKLDHKVFDPLVDDPNEFRLTAHNNFKKVWDLFGGRGISLEKVADMMVNQYKLGILRDAGPIGVLDKIEEAGKKWKDGYKPYDHAFSVKDGLMVVDWDALEVTKENALEISIASWKWTYQWMLDNGEKPEKGGDACALCYVRVTCQGCEIRDVARHCMYTPFPAYSDAETLHEALDACRDEIAFLEGLR
jgi:hypothetical protein